MEKESFRWLKTMKETQKRVPESIQVLTVYHVVQIVEDAYHAVCTFGNSLLLLDRYFLTVPALERLSSLNSSGNVRMEIITKAKKSCTAFEKPCPRKPGRERPQKKELLST